MPSKCLLKCLSKNFCLVRVNLALFTMKIHLRSFVVLKCIEKNTKTPKPKLTHICMIWLGICHLTFLISSLNFLTQKEFCLTSILNMCKNNTNLFICFEITGKITDLLDDARRWNPLVEHWSKLGKLLSLSSFHVCDLHFEIFEIITSLLYTFYRAWRRYFMPRLDSLLDFIERKNCLHAF